MVSDTQKVYVIVLKLHFNFGQGRSYIRKSQSGDLKPTCKFLIENKVMLDSKAAWMDY